MGEGIVGFEIETVNREQQPIRVLLAKPGSEAHDGSLVMFTHALRGAGMDVRVAGRHPTPEMIVSIAAKENVDAICVSVSADTHQKVLPEIIRLMKAKGIEDIPLLGGGAVQPEDIAEIKSMGVTDVFVPGVSPSEIIDGIRRAVFRYRM